MTEITGEIVDTKLFRNREAGRLKAITQKTSLGITHLATKVSQRWENNKELSPLTTHALAAKAQLEADALRSKLHAPGNISVEARNKLIEQTLSELKTLNKPKQS